jgi:hypothetical protein
MTDHYQKALAAVRALPLPRHAHDFRYGDVVYLIDSNSPMKIVGFHQENDGPFMARCFKMSDFRQTTMEYDVAKLRRFATHQPHATRQ